MFHQRLHSAWSINSGSVGMDDWKNYDLIFYVFVSWFHVFSSDFFHFTLYFEWMEVVTRTSNILCFVLCMLNLEENRTSLIIGRFTDWLTIHSHFSTALSFLHVIVFMKSSHTSISSIGKDSKLSSGGWALKKKGAELTSHLINRHQT